MYNYITGKVVYSAGNTIVVDNNGIGYEIGASNFTTNKFSEGEIAKIYTYLYSAGIFNYRRKSTAYRTFSRRKSKE